MRCAILRRTVRRERPEPSNPDGYGWELSAEARRKPGNCWSEFFGGRIALSTIRFGLRAFLTRDALVVR
jgi:hypothetical protein